MYQRGKRQSNKDGFYLSELTGQSIPVVMRILLLIKTIQLDPVSYTHLTLPTIYSV